MSLLETLFLLHHVSKFAGKPLHFLLHFAAFVSQRSWGPHFQNQRTSLYRKSELPDGFHFPATHHPIFGIAPKSLPDSYFSPLALEAWLPILLHPETIYDQFCSIDWERSDEKLTALHYSSICNAKNFLLQPSLTALRNRVSAASSTQVGLRTCCNSCTDSGDITSIWSSMAEISIVRRSRWNGPQPFFLSPERAVPKEEKLSALLKVLLVLRVSFDIQQV